MKYFELQVIVARQILALGKGPPFKGRRALDARYRNKYTSAAGIWWLTFAYRRCTAK
jgi:hypothetical protein